MERDEDVLRIECFDSPTGGATLRLVGSLVASELETLLDSVDSRLGPARELEIDLAELRYMDEQGAQLLCALRESGAKLAQARGYVAELLRAVERER